MGVDFGRTARDYAKYRTVFPPELFARLAELGVGMAGHRVVDLATGTGTLARGFAAHGATVTGLDIAPEMLELAAELDTEAGLAVTYRQAPAEDTGLPGSAWDVVSAGQAWHWFDRPRVAAEADRLLVDGGALAICYRDYVVEPGNVCAVSEDLVLTYNPDWPLAKGAYSQPRWIDELAAAGFADVTRIDFDVDVPFTHEEWRGRMRSSNGVGASLSDAQVTAFDAELAALLHERFPAEPLLVTHQIWAIVACR